MNPEPPYFLPHTFAHGEYTRLPPPPDGMEWIHRRDDWLYLRDQWGRFFYVRLLHDGALLLVFRALSNWWDWLRTRFRLKPGTYYADWRFTIFIPSPCRKP